MAAGSAKLELIPDGFGLEHFRDVHISSRSKGRGYNFFVNGYVHNFFFGPDTQQHSLNISAKCYRSMRKNESPHNINLTISDIKITDCHCSCKAGISGTCAHVVAVVHTLQHFKQMGLKEIPSDLPSTSLPQQWHKPRGAKIFPEPVAAMVFAKAKQTPRKRKPIFSSILGHRVPEVTGEDLKKLKMDPALPLSYLLNEDLPFESHEFGAVQQGSILPLHVAHYKNQTIVVQKACGETRLPQLHCHVRVDRHYQPLNAYFKTDQQGAEKIENKTVKQSDSSVWFEERSRRLTASNFARVCKRKKDVNEKFLNAIFQSGQTFNCAATSYGKNNENVAKQKYLDQCPEHHLHDCGLVINPQFSYLAATPDAKICVNEMTGIMEVKCPYAARDLTIKEAIANIPSFCLTLDTENIVLKKQHDYHYQVQGQLLVTGTTFCMFVVFTKKEIFVEKIFPDYTFQQTMLNHLSQLYLDHAVKHLCLQIDNS